MLEEVEVLLYVNGFKTLSNLTLLLFWKFKSVKKIIVRPR